MASTRQETKPSKTQTGLATEQEGGESSAPSNDQQPGEQTCAESMQVWSENSLFNSLSSSSFMSFVLAEEDDLGAPAKAKVLDIFKEQYSQKIAEKEQNISTLKKECERREQELKVLRNEVKKLESQIARVKTIIREKEVSLCSLSDRLEDIQYERGFLKRKESLCDARIHEFIAFNENQSKKLKRG